MPLVLVTDWLVHWPRAGDTATLRLENGVECHADPICRTLEDCRMKKSQFKSLAQNMSVLIASVMMCHGNVIAAESPGSVGSLTQPTKESKAAIRYRKAVEDGCNDYALTRSQYMACNEQRARELPPLDPARREHFGELYDPVKFLQCKKDGFRQGKDCELHALRRLDQPEYWPYPDVPPMKWPEAPTPSVYEQLKKKQLLVTAKDYFEALCKAEAGEFIYRTVEGVEGVYEIRPSRRATDSEFEDRYVLEDPWNASSSGWRTFKGGNAYWESFGDQFVQPNHGKFKFAETPFVAEGRVSRIVRAHRKPESETQQTRTSVLAGKFVQVPYVVAWIEAEAVTARFGFTWRGIQRPHDRDLNIAGSELAIVDLKSNEVIALRREFVKTGKPRNRPTSANWETAAPCSWPHIVLPNDFINRALRPIQQ